jgi:hypothetical protein
MQLVQLRRGGALHVESSWPITHNLLTFKPITYNLLSGKRFQNLPFKCNVQRYAAVPPRAGGGRGGAPRGRAVPAGPHLRRLLPPRLVLRRRAGLGFRC